MSTPVKPEAPDPGSPEYYAPRKLRDILADPPSIQPQVDASAQPRQRRSFFDRRRRVDNGSSAEPFPDSLPRFLRAEDRAVRTRIGRKWLLVVLAGSGVAACAAVAVFYFDRTTPADRPDAALLLKDAKASLAERLQAASSALDRGPAKVVPPTVGVEDQNGTINAPLPVGIDVTNPTSGSIVKFTGLLPGASLNTGAASGQGEWRIGVEELPKTVIIPPRDFIGSMPIVAELQGSGGQIVVRSRVRYSWKQPVAESSQRAESAPAPAKAPVVNKVEAPKPSEPAAAKKEASNPIRQIDPSEVALLLKRSEELIASGDLAAARLLLERVAETHNARAAFELGATYDPLVIRQRGIVSAAADTALAQTWYQRAREWGSEDAAKQLEALASVRR